MKPKGSLLCSQEAATGPYPEPDEYSPQLPIQFRQDCNIILPSTPRSSKLSLPSIFSDQNFAHISYPSHACYMTTDLIPLVLITLISSEA